LPQASVTDAGRRSAGHQHAGHGGAAQRVVLK
jgi:hypothetical protein